MARSSSYMSYGMIISNTFAHTYLCIDYGNYTE